MINAKITVSLVITTYNWPQALQLVLLSILQQHIMPTDVIIADDGSTPETKQLITQFQPTFPVPLFHCWHEDLGFRAGQIRNKAMAQSKNDYIILIDGDMVLDKHFVADHLAASKTNRFIQGRRVILDKNRTEQAIETKNIHFSRCSSGVNNKFNTLRCPCLSPFVSPLFSKKNTRSVRSCNMSFWRNDVININGFNEDFIGWGREDSEFVVRLLNNGIERYDLRLAGVAYHLYHNENSRNNLSKNDTLLKEAMTHHLTWCKHGISPYLPDKTHSSKKEYES